MGFVDILSVILGVLQFPKQVNTLIRLLQGISPEKRAELMAALEAEGKKLKETGRPTWGS